MTRSGAAAATLPKCKFFDQMAFLHEKSANKPTESNLSLIEAGIVVPADEPQFSMPSPSGSVASSCSATTSSLKKRKSTPQAKKARGDMSEADLNKSLVDCDELLKKSMSEDVDEDSLYCRSLIPIMRELPKRKKRLAKIKISQLLFDLEYSEDDL